MCIYKMVLKITKETWEKLGIKTVNYYNEKKDIIALRQKRNDLKTQTKHTNIADVVLGGIKKYYGKKTKNISKEEKQKYKAYFEDEKGVFIIEKLTCDAIERCKLP